MVSAINCIPQQNNHSGSLCICTLLSKKVCHFFLFQHLSGDNSGVLESGMELVDKAGRAVSYK